MCNKKKLTLLVACIAVALSGMAKGITDVKQMQKVGICQVKTSFAKPPVRLANHVIWGWDGQMELKTITSDLDSIKSKGFNAIIIEPGYGLPFDYLSEGWFKTVRTAVMEAKKRGMKVWIIDEGKYPSGFAGGKFTRERPDLRMKAVVAVGTIKVNKGEVIKDRIVIPEGQEGKEGVPMSAVAVNNNDKENRMVEIKDGKITFYAGDDDWEIMLAGWGYRTGQTRAVNNPTRGKDTKNSICDYLSPEAVRQYIDWTHEQYKHYMGDEFGVTILGFRGDEPDFAYTPWTPRMVEEFTKRKGYDPRPHLASLLAKRTTVEERRFRADYWDVWSDLFAINFFKQQADWCEENGLEHITHLNNDHNMPVCVRAEGNLFRDLSKIQIPGVDAIWNQIWPKTVNDFPKFASSVSHVYGKPRSFSESFAAYNTPPTIPTARYAVDYQMVRGINFFEFMFWGAGSKGKNWMTDPGMKLLNDYTNRATYLLTMGKPGARVAVYYPTSTLWLNNQSINHDLVEMAELLLQHQRDFDWVDADAFSEALDVEQGCFVNKSGQRYSTLIIPSCDAISKDAWQKIAAFAEKGGKVLFWGRKPTMLSDKTFRDAMPIDNLTKNVMEEPSVTWTATVESAMPTPEFNVVKGDAKFLRYTRRVLDDADIYFIFNEGEESCTFTADIDQSGIVSMWDADKGTFAPMNAEHTGDKTRISMELKPWESHFITIERGNKAYNVKKNGVKGDGTVETAAIQSVIDKVFNEGGGTVVFPKGKYLTGALFFPRGVNLRVEKNALVQGVVDTLAYKLVSTRFEGYDRNWKCALLNFDNAEGVQVSGEGTIDGNGVEWKKIPFGTSGRPRLFCFTNCNGGSIKGLHLRNQASWCLHLLYTKGFTIDGVDIRVPEYVPSSDGIDIDSSTDVAVRNTYISVHDDCISIKSGKDAEGRRIGRPSENILIENCHFGYGHGAVTMGSEISGGINNVLVRNCKVDEGNWAPFRFKSQPARGGVVQNITFENVTFENVKSVFDVNLEWMSGRIGEKVVVYADKLTQLRNVTLRNCKGTAKAMGVIRGYKNEPIARDVFRFENCDFKADSPLKVEFAEVNL